MLRFRIALIAGLLFALGGVLAAQEEAGPPAGTWKVTLPTLEQAKGLPVWLLKFEKDKAGKWSGSVLDKGELFKDKGQLAGLSVTTKQMSLTIKHDTLDFVCEVNFGKDAKAGKLFGEATIRRDVFPLELVRSELTKLDGYSVLREEIANEPLGMTAVVKARQLIQDAAENKAKATEVRAWAKKATDSAQQYGPKMLREELTTIALLLAQQKGFEPIGLQYAMRAESDLNEKEEGPVATKAVLDVLAAVQEKAGKKDDMAKTYARIKKLDFRFKPKEFLRKGKSDRIVLAELFTGSQAKSAIASAMAVEALQKRYGAKQVAVLAYHQHFPDGDPLGSNESEERLGFYGKNVTRLPVIILNGRLVIAGGGDESLGKERFDQYSDRIDPLLETDSKAELKLDASRKGDKITINTEVSKLEESGDDIRLRVVLVEASPPYEGASGVKVHCNVVRAMPGGFEGTVLKDKMNKKSFTVDLADLKKKLEKYQEEVNKKRPFPKDSKHTIELKNLRVIAFVQNDANSEVMQAAQVELP